MSIDIETLQRTFPTARTLPRQRSGGSEAAAPFSRVLAALGKEGASAAAAQRDAVQELMHIELMQSSLSIGDSGAPHSYQSPALASLLNGLAAYREAAQGAQQPAQQAADALPPLQSASTAATGEISRTAAQFLGTPYRFGGEGASGIDCSSFVQQVFREHRIDLPRTAREQIAVGKDVARSEMKEGDLVFFRTYASYPSHVGIYLGDGKMIHASSRAGEVTVSDMNTPYFQSRYIGAKRVT